MFVPENKKEHLNKYRFKLLAILLSLHFVLPPFTDLPVLEAVKTLALKILLIFIGAEFVDAGRKRGVWYIVGVANILLGVTSFIFHEKYIIIFLIEYLSLVAIVIFLFYFLMRQIANMKKVTSDGIIGAFSGYVLLGMIAFFTYLSLNISSDGMFSNLGDGIESLDRLFYYSFISLTTIGFGDIVPTHAYSQKLTIFFGIIGQFYIAVNVAILVSKYMTKKEN
jgi:ion channel